jgi:translation initiation factor IF-2
MSLTRIYQVAKDNDMTSKEVLDICSKIGLNVKSHSSGINDDDLKKLLSAIKKVKSNGNKEKDTEKIKHSKLKDRIEDKDKSSINLEENKEAYYKFLKKGSKEEDKISKWEEEKKLNIKNVLLKELDKEEKFARVRSKPRQVTEKDSITTIASHKLKDKKKIKQKKEDELKKRPEIKKIIELPVGVTIKQLSEKINVPSNEIIKTLIQLGEFANINQTLSNDIIGILSDEYNFKYSIIGFEEELEDLYKDDPKNLLPRPPIVTIMGHVDHGKTTLLDAIRKSDVAENEAGGITQHIGAYQVEYNRKKITFIDTPGHEAFTAIRARGAKVTDIAVIVVAADDGIMPQTVEAIDHAKAANVPIIIAINKIDLPDADPSKIKKSLTEYGVIPEEWGGDTICVEVSAKNKININELLEMILFVAELHEIKGNPNAEGYGIIIESRLDKGLGPIGTIVVRRGSIKVGDFFVTGNSYGKVRALKDDRGNKIEVAFLSQPVEVLGFSSVPSAGDRFFVVKNEKIAKDLLERRAYLDNLNKISESKKHISLEELSKIVKLSEIKKLGIILKADANGSLDAVEQALKKIEDETIKIDIIHKAVGAITDSDIILAAASNAIVIGFGVVPTPKAKELAKSEKVEIRTYDIIYKLIDELILAFKGMLEPETAEVEKAKVEVREIFKMPKSGIVAGCYVSEGEVERNNLVRIIRDGKIIYKGKIASIHRFKEDVKKVAAGYECGIKIENFQDMNKGDIFEVYEIKEVKKDSMKI